MKWRLLVPGLMLIMAAVGWFFFRDVKPAADSVSGISSLAGKAMEEAARLRGTGELPGEEILKHYGDPDLKPEADLKAMAHAFSNLSLLVKGDTPFRLGANEEFAAALMGQNAAKMVFLAPPHPCLNARGQLVDRWSTPLFFHVNDASRIDIRSAGEDRVMWTPDDLHRRHDGEFFRGASMPESKPR